MLPKPPFQNLPTPATLPQPPRRSRARRYHPRRRRVAGSLLAYIPGLILERAEVPVSTKRLAILAAMGVSGDQVFNSSLFPRLTRRLVSERPESVKGAPLLGAAKRNLSQTAALIGATALLKRHNFAFRGFSQKHPNSVRRERACTSRNQSRLFGCPHLGE